MSGSIQFYEGQRSRFEAPRGEDDSPSNRTTGSWRVAVGMFVIQLTVPITFYSYGVLLSRLVEGHRLQVWHGLLPPVTYVVIRCFADPVCRNILSGQSYNSVSTAFGGVLLITGGITANGFFESVITEVLTLGVLIGICTSVVVIQAEASLYCHYPSRRGFRKSLCHVALALGQFGVPLLMNRLIYSYGIYGGFLLQSGLVLHGLIGALLLSPPKEGSHEITYTRRPRAYTVVNDVEMVDFPHLLDSGNSGHSPLLSSGRSWKNPGNTSDTKYGVAQTSSPISEMRHKTVNGVDILPKIPEECEESDDDDSTSDNSSPDNVSNRLHLFGRTTNRWGEPYASTHREVKRSNPLSNRYSHERRMEFQSNSLQKWKSTNFSNVKNDVLHDVNHESGEVIKVKNDERNNDEEISLSVESNDINVRERRLSSTEAQHDTDRVSFFQRIRHSLQCAYGAKYCFYDCYIGILNIPNHLQFYMVVPFINAVKVPGFFPSIFPCILLRLCPVLFATFAPPLTRARVVTSTFQEGAFTVSVAAFGLFCFTLLTPCLSEIKIIGQKLIYFFGCLLIATGFYLISSTRTHGQFVLGSALFGFGMGASITTVTEILECDLGMRDFVRIQGPLDAVSGLFIILIAVILGFLLQDENGMELCFITLMVLQLSSGTIWMLSLLKPLFKKIQCFPNSKWHAGELIAQVH